MLPDLYVRPACALDEAPLADLIESIGPQCRPQLVPVLTAQTLVAIQTDQPVGFVSWQQDEMQAVIVGLGVGVNHRRFGVATLLVETLADHLRDAGLRLLEVAVPCACTFLVPVFKVGRFRQIGQSSDGDIFFERRLWGRRNQADGFSRMETYGIC